MSQTSDNWRRGKDSADRQKASLPGRLLGRDRAIIVVCAIVGAAVGAYRLWTVAPQYVATARLYVEPTDAVSTAGVGSSVDGKSSGNWTPPTDLLLGTEVGNLAVQIANLRSLPCFANVPDLPLRIVSNLEIKTSAAQSGPGQIQDLRFVAADRKAAEQVLEGMISAYEITAERWRTQRINDSLAALERQRGLLLERLQKKQGELQRFKDANPSAFQANDSLVLDGRLKAMVEARIRAEIRRIEAEVRLATVQAMMSAGPAQTGGTSSATTRPAEAPFDAAVANMLFPRGGFDNGLSVVSGQLTVLPRNEAGAGYDTRTVQGTVVANAPATADALAATDAIDLDAEKGHIRRLEETWGPDHPKLRAAKEHLAELQQRSRRQADRSVRAAEAYFRLCRDEEERLQRAIDAQQRVVSPNPGGDTAVQAKILQQVVDRSGKLLASVCERLDHLSLESAAAGMAGIKITTVVPPNTVPFTTSDQSPRLFLVPTGIGLLIGFALTYLRNSKAAPTTPTRATELGSRSPVTPKSTVLGWVPPLPQDGGRGSQRALGTWVLRESGSKAAKAFRRLGKHLVHAAAKSEARCVLVSSGQPREGKSVVLANVATAIAQTGQKVLLIDANYDHPSQHVLLSDILSLTLEDEAGGAGEITVESLKSGRVAMRTQMETLSVVPAWPKPARPMEILESTALRDFVRQSASKYDLVLIDAPAVTHRTEVELLAEASDAVVYVTDAANTNTQNERELLRQLDLPSIGSIANTVPSASNGRPGGAAANGRSEAPARPSKRHPGKRTPAPEPTGDDAVLESEAQPVLSGAGEDEPPSEPTY